MKSFFHFCVRTVAVATSLHLAIGGSVWAQSSNVLQLHPQNSHYFRYQGKPLVIVGSGEHYGAVMNADFNYTVYLNTLKRDGLNTTRLFTGAYYEQPGAFGIEHNTMAPPEKALLLPWQKEGDKYNLDHWNEAYFVRLHHFMQQAQQSDVIVEITLFSSYYGAGWPYHPFNGSNNTNGTPTALPANKVNTLENGAILKFQEAYVRKLVHELNRYDNLYFEIQNEPWAETKDTALVWNDYLTGSDLKEPGNNWKNTLEIASEASRAWHKTVSGWITNEEKKLPKKHLISHNIANFKLPVWATDPAISIYTFHYAQPDAVALNYGLNKVIGFNETGFAGKSDDTYRRQAWRFMMRGGGLFNHLDYSFTVGHEDGTDTTNNAPGGGSPTLRRYLQLLKKYLDGLDLATLRPDKTFISHAAGAFVYTMQDAHNKVVYLEPLFTTPATLYFNLAKGTYRAEWTDVRSGATLKTETLHVTSLKTVLTSPAGIADVVLTLKKLP